MDAKLREDMYIEEIKFQNYMEDIFLVIIVLVKFGVLNLVLKMS